jgi:sugar/nucleoside kinase (ribokinase family)
MPPAFLAIGHFCQDVTPNGYTIGGGAAYSTVTARNLGLGTHAVTSVAEDFNRKNPVLDRINVTYHDSIETTIFDNQYDQYGKRRQMILGIGDKLQPSHIPIELQNTGIVYLCPIADEVDPELVRCFKHSLIGVTPQGWMRQWGSSRQVRPKRWDTAEKILSHTDILVLSDEDILANPKDLDKYIQWTKIVVLTRGKNGAVLYENGQVIESSSYSVKEVDPTGAGDVFAAAFLINYYDTGSSVSALNFAHCVASFAVEGRGLTAIPTLEQVKNRIRPQKT